MLYNLAVSLSTLELLEEQKYDQFCHLILASKASDPSSSFFEGHGGLLRRCRPLISELQPIFILYRIQKIQCMVVQQ